jgi:PAS domain-containing protein
MRTKKIDRLSEDAIHRLVDDFYAKIRVDPDLGPVFARAIPGDWGPHLATMRNFWSSVMLTTGRYKTALRDAQDVIIGYLLIGTDNSARKQAEEALLKAGALQSAIFNSANFSSIATDAKGVIQIFNVGAERMLGYTAAEVMNKITPADISDPQELIARAKALSVELGTTIAPGFEALVFKASRGIEDIYELTYIRKDGSRFPAEGAACSANDIWDDQLNCYPGGQSNLLLSRPCQPPAQPEKAMHDSQCAKK